MAAADLAKALNAALEARLPTVENYAAYYEGRHKLAFATSKWRETFGALFAELSDNWCQLVVDAAVERLRVMGFRFGPDDDRADEEAWALWQANYLDADSRLAHTEACKSGIAYVLVLPGDDPDTPRITVESPAQVIVQTAPDDRRRRLAGLKRWRDDDGTERAVLYLPDSFHRYARRKDRRTWLEDGAAVPNPIGIVPVVPMLNNPTLLGDGISDLNVVLSLQDAINKLLADMLVNSEYVAFPQRFAVGLEIPTDPETGRPLDRERFLSSVSRLWVAEDGDVKFGQLPEAEGTAPLRLIELLIQHVAAETRTPPHYLLGQSGNFPSGESLKATETGLVEKCKAKQAWYGETWEESMRLAFLYRGDQARGAAASAETLWADPESRSEGELVDALLKLRTLGYPYEVLWAMHGESPQQIARMLRMTNLPDRTEIEGAAGGTANQPPEGATPEGQTTEE
jgi:Phage portal protein, SPP1 Gp6-like